MQIAQVELPTFDGIGKVPALVVVTDPNLPSSLVGAEPKQLAALLREDRQSLDYFWQDALNPARANRMKQTKLEAIAAALGT